MDQDLYLFRQVTPSNLVDEAFKFDPNTLGELDTLTISKYLIALGQYLIYFTSEVNRLKATMVKKRRLFDSSVSIALTPDILKQYKTKIAATTFLVNTTPKLSELKEKLNVLNEELAHVEGIDKSINEYINTFKRELSRREQELFTTRTERRL